MKSKNFEKKLQQTLHQPSAITNPKHLKQTIFLARTESYQKHQQERISFFYFLSKQIKFIGWKIWSVQGIFLFLINHMLLSFYGQYFWETPRTMIRLLFCLSILVAMSALPFLYRVIRYQMQEIEAATYFSSMKLLMAKLTVIGIGDVLLLAGIFAVAISKTSLRVGNISFYLCFPFLLVSSGFLFMLGHFPAKYFFTRSMEFCSLLICIAIIAPKELALLFEQTLSLGWFVVCGILIVFCARQCHYILHHCPYTEMQVDY